MMEVIWLRLARQDTEEIQSYYTEVADEKTFQRVALENNR